MKLIVGIPLWLVAFVLRFVLIAIGYAAVGFSLAGDGELRSPRIWQWWRPRAHVPASFEVAWWTYLWPVLFGLLAFYSFGNWHELVTIYFIFSCVGIVIALSNSYRWREYWWFAVRNPVEGLDSLIKQPVFEVKPNPDDVVRSGARRFDQRFMQSDLFWEYWLLFRINDERFFEFRIGWKFVDGNEDFVPTLQFGPKR